MGLRRKRMVLVVGSMLLGGHWRRDVEVVVAMRVLMMWWGCPLLLLMG